MMKKKVHLLRCAAFRCEASGEPTVPVRAGSVPWGAAGVGSVLATLPTRQSFLQTMFRSRVCADGWQRHPAADDTGKTVAPSALFASSQPTLCTTGGGRERGSLGSTGWELGEEDGCIRQDGICWRVQKCMSLRKGEEEEQGQRRPTSLASVPAGSTSSCRPFPSLGDEEAVGNSSTDCMWHRTCCYERASYAGKG